MFPDAYVVYSKSVYWLVYTKQIALVYRHLPVFSVNHIHGYIIKSKFEAATQLTTITIRAAKIVFLRLLSHAGHLSGGDLQPVPILWRPIQPWDCTYLRRRYTYFSIGTLLSISDSLTLIGMWNVVSSNHPIRILRVTMEPVSPCFLEYLFDPITPLIILKGHARTTNNTTRLQL